MIVLDTHTLVWLDSGDTRLGKQSLTNIDRAFTEHQLYVCAISFWEIASTLAIDANLCTADEKIIAWMPEGHCLDARI